MRKRAFMILGLMAAATLLMSCGGGGGSNVSVPQAPKNVNQILGLPMNPAVGGLPRRFDIVDDTIVLTKYMYWSDDTVGAEIPNYSYVSLISADQLQPVANIKVPQNPQDVAVTSNLTAAYVVHATGGVVSKIDLVNKSLVAKSTLNDSDNPVRVLLSADETGLYILCHGPSELKIANNINDIVAADDEFIISTTIDLGDSKPTSMALNATDNLLYIGTLDGHILIIDLSTNTIATKSATAKASIYEYDGKGKQDTDYDGFSDYCEIMQDTDPYNYLDKPDDCDFVDEKPAYAYIETKNLPLTDLTQISIIFDAETVKADWGEVISLDPYANNATVDYTWEVDPDTGTITFKMNGKVITAPMMHQGTFIKEMDTPISVKGTAPAGVYSDESRIWDLDLATAPSGERFLAVAFDRQDDEWDNIDDKVAVARVGNEGTLPSGLNSEKTSDSMVVAQNARVRSVKMKINQNNEGVVWGGSYENRYVWYAPISFDRGGRGDEMEFKRENVYIIDIGDPHKIWAVDIVGSVLYASSDVSMLTISTD